MSGFLDSLFNHAFLQNALLGGVLASVACGVMGTYVVVKRIGYLAGGIAHSVLGGMGIAYFAGESPIGGALVASIVAALIIGGVHLKWRQQEDTIISAIWAVGMALGVVFISRTPGYNIDLMSYLFGNILMISRGQLGLILIMDIVVIATVMLLYRQLLAVAFDEEYARLRGLPVTGLYLLLLCLVALTVVMLIQVVGLILVIALLTLPAAIARQYTVSLGRMMVLAALLGAAFTSGGLAISYGPDLPPGATIILLAGAAYLLSSVIYRTVLKRRARDLG
jgi:zinc transport system permease protein